MLGSRLISHRSLAFCSRRLLVNNTRMVGSAATSSTSWFLTPHSSTIPSSNTTSVAVRTMASKKKKKGGGTPKSSKPIEFMVEGLDQMYEECRATDFNQVLKQVAQSYKVMPGELSNGTYTMQIGNEYGDFENLTNFTQLVEASKEEEYPSIRVKELAEQDEEDDMDEYNDDVPDDDEDYPWAKDNIMGGGGDTQMKETIIELVEALKADGWRLVESQDELSSLDEFKLSKENGAEETSARTLVVKYAKDLPDLQDQLIMKIGSLDHIVQCLQFGFMWYEPEKQQEEEESEEITRDEEKY